MKILHSGTNLGFLHGRGAGGRMMTVWEKMVRLKGMWVTRMQGKIRILSTI